MAPPTIPWLYDEFAHSGVDHADPAYPARYEANMRRFRDFEKEAAATVETLGIGKSDTVVDLGAGTGAFAVPGAKSCRKMIAVDTSRAMLDFAAGKARAVGITNIDFVHAGFLTYEHRGEGADAVVSKMALHHLPDFWKAAALHNIQGILKPGGQVLLTDVVFSFPIGEYRLALEAEAEQLRRHTERSFADEAYVHFKEEFSTFDWILDRMLERVGFTIEDKSIHSPARITYRCRK